MRTKEYNKMKAKYSKRGTPCGIVRDLHSSKYHIKVIPNKKKEYLPRIEEDYPEYWL